MILSILPTYTCVGISKFLNPITFSHPFETFIVPLLFTKRIQ